MATTETDKRGDVQELIDTFLAETTYRTLIPVSEVQDFVLDLRNLLGAA